MQHARSLPAFLLSLLCTGAIAQPERWSARTDVPGSARHDAIGVATSTHGYLCLGLAGANPLMDLWEYDPTADTWTAGASFPGTWRNGAASFSVNGRIYVGTGFDGNVFLNDLWEYDPGNDSWTPRSALPGPARGWAVAFTLGNKGYLGTGSDGIGVLTDLWEYDPILDMWSAKAPLPNVMPNSAGFALNGMGYLLTSGTNSAAGIAMYDPASDSWTPMADIPDDLWYGTSNRLIGTSAGGRGLLIDMGPADNPVSQAHPNTSWSYDPGADSWLAQSAFTGTTRDGATTFTLDGLSYVLCGSHYMPWDDYRYDLDDLWVFDPHDCAGVAHGTALPGTQCDDGNTATYNDRYDIQCTCVGSTTPAAPFHPDAIDPSFNTGTGFDGDVLALAVQPDGKVIATGPFTSFNGTPCNGIARLNADGSLDASFGGALGGRALAIQPDGRILVGGAGIHRLMPQGSLDPSYDTDLSVIGDLPVAALLLRADGRIIAGGSMMFVNGNGENEGSGLMQLLPDGSPDPGFYQQMLYQPVASLVHRPDGRILAGITDQNIFALNLKQYTSDGAEDDPFNGAVGFSFPDPVRALALLPDGDVIVGGEFSIFKDDPHENNGVPRRRLARISAAGALVTSFDPGISTEGVVHALALGPQGQILVGGDFAEFQGLSRSGLVQVNAYGYADPEFDPGTGFDAAVNVLLALPNGDLLVGGAFTSYDGIACGHITRLRTSGPLCLPSQLTTTADPVISCGAVNLKFNGTSTIAATEVPGANKYQFRFTNTPGQPAYARTIAFPTRSFTLTPWYTKPLKAGRTYNVQVRASFDNGATWCDYGPSCTVKISWTPLAPFTEPRGFEAAYTEEPTELLLYPNPTNGDLVRIQLGGIDPELTIATLDITDLFGKRVMSTTLPLNDGVLNTSVALPGDLAGGLYIVNISAADQVYIERLMIAR